MIVLFLFGYCLTDKKEVGTLIPDIEKQIPTAQ